MFAIVKATLFIMTFETIVVQNVVVSVVEENSLSCSKLH